MISRIPSVSGQFLPTRFSYTNPISTSTEDIAWEFCDFQQWLLAIFPIEFTLFCILILLIILIAGYLIYKRFQCARQRTQIFLEITDGEKDVQFKIFGLNYNPEHYRFAVMHDQFILQTRRSWFRGQILLIGGLQVTNLKLQLSVLFPTQYSVSLFKANKIEYLLKVPHCVNLLIFDAKFQLIDIVLLHELGRTTAPDHHVQTTHSLSLYPALSAP